MTPNSCNGFNGIGLLDYAYLALNVYKDHKKDDGLLGTRPPEVFSLMDLSTALQENKNGWHQLAIPELHLPNTKGLYAEFYVKIYGGKIQHLMVAFRGTYNWGDGFEDIKTWYQSVLDNPDAALPTPDYWHRAVGFMQSCTHVITHMATMGLLAKDCDHHVTGHSLGGAIANLIAGSALICTPPDDVHPWLPIAPHVISFNAPGIGTMPYVCDSRYHEGQVIGMRAKYDCVSAIGKPYGYVINNDVPEGRDLAKIDFALHRAKTFTAGFVADILQNHCDNTPGCAAAEDIVEVANGYFGLYEQHSMHNFLQLIANHPDSISTTHMMLANWSINHGGMNHDEAGVAMY